jgi:hypothetical protein
VRILSVTRHQLFVSPAILYESHNSNTVEARIAEKKQFAFGRSQQLKQSQEAL